MFHNFGGGKYTRLQWLQTKPRLGAVWWALYIHCPHSSLSFPTKQWEGEGGRVWRVLTKYRPLTSQATLWLTRVSRKFYFANTFTICLKPHNFLCEIICCFPRKRLCELFYTIIRIQIMRIWTHHSVSKKRKRKIIRKEFSETKSKFLFYPSPA